MKRFSGGGLGEGTSFTGNLGRYVKKVSGCVHLLPEGPISNRLGPGIWGGGWLMLVYRGSESWMKEGARNGTSLCEGFYERDLEEGLCTGETERYVKRSSEMDIWFHRGLTFRGNGWALLSWSRLIRGNFMGSLGDMQYAL
jgi:hypothetical protein